METQNVRLNILCHLNIYDMDILDITNEPRPVEYYANKYPGFPRFIHEIMYHVDHGKSPEEAASLSCDNLNSRLRSVIEEVEATHAYLDQDGKISLPPLVLEYIDKHGEEDGQKDTDSDATV